MATLRGMGAYVAAPDSRWPNGQPLAHAGGMGAYVPAPAVRLVNGRLPLVTRGPGMSGIVAAPFLRTYPNGRPMRQAPTLIAKNSLVKAVLANKGLKGLGDVSTDITDTTGLFDVPPVDPGYPSVTYQPPVPTYTPDTTGLFEVPQVGVTYNPAVNGGAGPSNANLVPYLTSTPQAGNTPLSQLIAGIASMFGGSRASAGYGAPQYAPAYNAGSLSTLGAKLNTPIYAGAPFSWMNLIEIGVPAAVVLLLVTGKKRR